MRDRAARVRAWRDRVWPSLSPRLAEPPAPQPAPEAPPPVTPPVLPARSEAVPGRITIRLVLEVTAAHFGLTVDDLLSDRRTQPLCRQRQIAMYVAHRTTGRSLVYIGRKIGRDHTTVLHACRTVEALIDAGNADISAAVDQIVSRLTGEAR